VADVWGARTKGGSNLAGSKTQQGAYGYISVRLSGAENLIGVSATGESLSTLADDSPRRGPNALWQQACIWPSLTIDERVAPPIDSIYLPAVGMTSGSRVVGGSQMKLRLRGFGLSRRSFWSAATALELLLAVACGGDDTEVVVLSDSGQDRASTGGRSGADAGGDGGQAGSGGSAGKGGGGAGTAGTGGKGGGGTGGNTDSGTGASGGADGGLQDGRDGGAGTTVDGNTDAVVDVADATVPPDADAGPTLTIDQYQHAIGVAWCDRIAECCQIDLTLFDRDKCIRARDTDLGPELVNAYLRKYKLADAGFPPTLAFVASHAAQCITLQRNRGCDEDGNEKRSIYSTCMGALQGSVGAGGTCMQSVECISNLYCALGADGGTGICTPLAQQGQVCADPNSNSDQCTWLGIHSSTTLHCATGGETTPTCELGLPLAQTCRLDQECASGVCSSTSRACVGAQAYPSQATCNGFRLTVPDANEAATDSPAGN
jgi:hypothetical protein